MFISKVGNWRLPDEVTCLNSFFSFVFVMYSTPMLLTLKKCFCTLTIFCVSNIWNFAWSTCSYFLTCCLKMHRNINLFLFHINQSIWIVRLFSCCIAQCMMKIECVLLTESFCAQQSINSHSADHYKEMLQLWCNRPAGEVLSHIIS